MPRLQTLKPRIATLANRTLRVAETPRFSGRRLQRTREAQFRANPLCVRCEERGIIRLATQSDHKHALINGGAESMENRQLLCDECHTEKTREDMKIAMGVA